MMALPLSCRQGLSDRRAVTATLVVTRMLLSGDVVCGAVHSDMYRSHSELELFSNKLHIWEEKIVIKKRVNSAISKVFRIY